MLCRTLQNHYGALELVEGHAQELKATLTFSKQMQFVKSYIAGEHRIRKRGAVLSRLPTSETNADVICIQD